MSPGFVVDVREAWPQKSIWARITAHAEPPMRNVWSAAVLQAKNENDRIGLRECIRPLLE